MSLDKLEFELQKHYCDIYVRIGDGTFPGLDSSCESQQESQLDSGGAVQQPASNTPEDPRESKGGDDLRRFYQTSLGRLAAHALHVGRQPPCPNKQWPEGYLFGLDMDEAACYLNELCRQAMGREWQPSSSQAQRISLDHTFSVVEVHLCCEEEIEKFFSLANLMPMLL